jgi:hypothetical protein
VYPLTEKGIEDADCLDRSQKLCLQKALRAFFHFRSYRALFLLTSVVPMAVLRKKSRRELTDILDELEQAPHALFFATGQKRLFQTTFDVLQKPSEAYASLTDDTAVLKPRVRRAMLLNNDLRERLRKRADTCFPRSHFSDNARSALWGLSRGYFKAIGPIQAATGQPAHLGLATSYMAAQTVAQFVKATTVRVCLNPLPTDAVGVVVVADADTAADVVRRGGRGVPRLLRQRVKAKGTTLHLAGAHRVGVDAFAQFVERLKGRVFKEVCFYGSLDARSNAWHANGCLFDDLARRFGTEGAPEQGLLVRMPEGDWEQQRVEKKAQLLVLTREQQRVAHAQLKVRENLFRASQPLLSPTGKLVTLSAVWREDGNGRVFKRVDTISPSIPHCFFQLIGDPHRKKAKDLHGYKNATVAILHSLNSGGPVAMLAGCASWSRNDERRARELFETLYVPANYEVYAHKKKVPVTFLAHLL